MQVDIYIETDNQIQREQLHRYGYVMATFYKGELKTVTGFGKAKETFHGTILTALLEAVNRLKGTCELTVYARDPYIMRALVTQVPAWISADWIRANGEPVKHAALWKQISARLEALNISQIRTEKDRHEYSSWLQAEIKKQIMNEMDD